jgi:head-tail adaptor
MLGPQTQVSIQRTVETSDGVGGYTQTWTTLGYLSGVLTSSIRGSLKYIAQEAELYGKETLTTHLTFFCDVPKGITITEKDRLVLGSRTFNIRFVYDPGLAHHHLELMLEEIV